MSCDSLWYFAYQCYHNFYAGELWPLPCIELIEYAMANCVPI